MRTLIISPNWIGDAVMAQPLLRLLHERLPTTPIDVLATSATAPVWRAVREVNTVLVAPFQHGKLQLRERRAYARLLRQQAYDTAYILPNTWKYALIPWLAGIPKRVGYKGEMRYGILNVIHHDKRSQPRPMVPFYAALADAPCEYAPALTDLPRPALSVAAQTAKEVATRLQFSLDQPLVVFAPGAEFGSAKRWPASHFAALANRIARDEPALQVALMGSPKDRQVCDQILTLAPHVRNLAGETTLEDALALISRASGVVSNDSGLLHVAAALDRPAIAIYGPTDPQHAPPLSTQAHSVYLGLECAPCKQRECPLGHHRCMQEIVPARIWAHLRGMLSPAS